MNPAARPQSQRKRDALDRLESDVDAWVATADPDSGLPYLTPLSFLWNGESLLLSTPASTPTGRNFRATGTVRLGIGLVRDVVLVEGSVISLSANEIDDDEAEAFAVRTGFDPRAETVAYVDFRVTPQRLTAWREANELKDRELMRDGTWLV